ncbi:MAG: 50S ribosomal protein L10 [Planctomycetota bacterium]|nr:50S ribosomal protein L10 [Planctomycetota bacterium]
MADLRPADKKPKGADNPNRISRLLVKKVAADYKQLSSLVALTNVNLNSEQTLELRVALRAKNARMHMVRNRLTTKALKELGLKDAHKLFVGPTYFLDAEDPVAAAKAAVEMVGKFKKSLRLAGGLLDGKVLAPKDVEALSRFRSRPELLGEVVMLAKSPGARLAAQLKGPGSRIAGAIKALVERLETAAAAPAAPAATAA